MGLFSSDYELFIDALGVSETEIFVCKLSFFLLRARTISNTMIIIIKMTGTQIPTIKPIGASSFFYSSYSSTHLPYLHTPEQLSFEHKVYGSG